MLELLYEPEAQKKAFIDACAWAEDIYLCLAWMEPGDTHGPSFADLEPHEAKVRQAIVGLARLQSYPALLWRLHRSSVLRLVSTVDGSFSPNCYLFKNGGRWRVLLGSAPFTSTRFARPCESLVVFEGERDDPFVLRAMQLLDRCRAAAHMSTSTELYTYEAAWANARTGGPIADAIAGLPLEPFNALTIGELTLLADPRAARDAFVEVRDSLSSGATMRLAARVLPHGAQPTDAALRTSLYWSSVGMWCALHRSNARLGLHFGFTPPWEVERPVASVSLSAGTPPMSLAQLAADGVRDGMAVARGDDGRRFLAHLGADAGTYTADVDVRDGATTARATLIGEIGAADFFQTAAAFAVRMSRRRDHQASEASS